MLANPTSANALTAENYGKGLLVDEELMAGVSESPDSGAGFVAFVLGLSAGEYLLYESHQDLRSALQRINSIQRRWFFERAGGCGEGNCGAGDCKGGRCGAGSCGTGDCPKDRR